MPGEEVPIQWFKDEFCILGTFERYLSRDPAGMM